MTIPDSTLKRWRELAERAVPGPWRVSIERLTKRAVVFDANDMWVADCGEDPDGARLIAEARTALPALLDLVAQLTRERDEAVRDRDQARSAYHALVVATRGKTTPLDEREESK